MPTMLPGQASCKTSRSLKDFYVAVPVRTGTYCNETLPVSLDDLTCQAAYKFRRLWLATHGSLEERHH
jgi:hypothetical protein